MKYDLTDVLNHTAWSEKHSPTKNKYKRDDCIICKDVANVKQKKDIIH